eukprot:scaffold161376_cov16-Prasinocladus_malaysianus.AAC.1
MMIIIAALILATICYYEQMWVHEVYSTINVAAAMCLLGTSGIVGEARAGCKRLKAGAVFDATM